MLTNIAKGVPISSVSFLKDVQGFEHVIVSNDSGSNIVLTPSKGSCKVINNFPTTNNSGDVAYSYVSNCVYRILGNSLIELDLDTGKKIVYDFSNKNIPYGFLGDVIRYTTAVYKLWSSPDGNVYASVGANFLNWGGHIKFNVITKEFDEFVTCADREFLHIHRAHTSGAYRFTDIGDLSGVYSGYMFNSNLDNIFTTIVSEISSAGLTWAQSTALLLHYEDREVGSTKRRVFAYFGGIGYTLIDLKSTSTYVRNNSSLSLSLCLSNNQWYLMPANTQVDRTNWNTGNNTLETWKDELGIEVPTWNAGNVYFAANKFGRYTYYGYYYLASLTYRCMLPVHPTTRELIYPTTVDKRTGFVTTSYDGSHRRVNFNSNYGFSDTEELVMFITYNGVVYFIRPDTHTWKACTLVENTVTVDGDNYTAVVVDPWGPTLNRGAIFGRWPLSVETEIDGRIYFTQSGFQTALAQEYLQTLINLGADITYYLLTDKTNIKSRISIKAKNLYASVSSLCNTIEAGNDNLLCASRTYNGIHAIERNGDTFNRHQYIPVPDISPNGFEKIDSNKAIVYGYLGRIRIIDFSNWENISSTPITITSHRETLHVCRIGDYLLCSGGTARQPNYYNGAAFDRVDLATNTSQSLSAILPNYINPVYAVDYRVNKLVLPNDTYTDVQCETALTNYISTSGKSRATILNEIKEAAIYRCGGILEDGGNVLIGTTYMGLRLLSGIRFETTPGSGVWIDYNYWDALIPARFLFIEDFGVATNMADFKLIEIYGTSVNSYSRVAQTDDYYVFMQSGTNSSLFTVTKNDILTDIDNEVSINNAATLIGIQIGDSSNFNNVNTQQVNCWASKGNYLYITIQSNLGGGLYGAVLRVDATDCSYVIFAQSSTSRVRTLSINDNKMLVTDNTSVHVVDNFESQTLPISL